MASVLLGKIDSFDPEVEEWPQYVERLEQFFEANELMGEAKVMKRRATFLSIIGPGLYKLLRSLIAPAKPTDKTLDELVATLAEHYSPKPSEVMQRFRFNSRSRKEGESVSAYVAELRRLTEFCNYGDTLSKMLRDRLVWGINDDSVQKKLLQETELTFARALTITQGAERAEQNLKEMKSPTESQAPIKTEPVQNVKDRSESASCYRCGKPGHVAVTCRFRDSVCHKCKKKGHLAQVCRSGSVNPAAQGTRGDKAKKRPVRNVQEEPSDADKSVDPGDLINAVDQDKESRLPPIKIALELDSCKVTMEVDTGASVSIMSETLYHKLWSGRRLDSCEIQLQTYSKEPLVVMGKALVQVKYEDQSVQLPLVIVKGEGPALFGRNWLAKIRLNWCKVHYMLAPGLQEVLGRHREVFQDGLGTYKGYEASIEVDPDAPPRFCKARSLPYAMRGMVEAELDRLVKEGSLEPVEYSDWATPIVAVLKSDRKSVRLCGDFRMTLNLVSKLNRYPIPKVEDLFATLSKGKVFTKIDLSQAYQQLKLAEESRKYVVINTHKGLFRYT